ncbi:MAG: CopG family transcriptional regulator [Micrococcales bacterium]|nr:CopG family transcriptional regulator [Micrococcales bacterium]
MTTNAEYVRKSFTIQAGLWGEVEELVGGGNQSAYIARALQRQVERDRLDLLLADLEAANGPVTAEEIDAVEREIA